MKKFYLFAAFAAIVATAAPAQVQENDTFTDEQGIVYYYDSDMWAQSYDDSEELSWIVQDGLAAKGHVVIPNEIQGEKVRVIGAGAFRNMEEMNGVNPNLTSITLPDNVEVIQMAAFLGCVNLKKIDLNNVHRVDYATFVNCDGLEEIHFRLPASRMKIGWEVFTHITEEGGFINDVIPATIYVPKGELQNYIDKFAQPFADEEDPMTWEENALYLFHKAGRLKEEGDGPGPATRGDLTGDGAVDVDDMNIVINMMLHKAEPTQAADINGDGVVDIDDMNVVINIMVGKE